MMGTLRPFGRTFLAAVALLMSASPALALNAGRLPANSGAELLLLRQANTDRAQRDLPALRIDPQLAQAARFHAEQMAAHADISHGFPGEPDLSMRGAAAGVHFSLITENVAEAGDAGVIHGLWMNSPGHRANLLDPEVNVVGIAVVVQGGAVYAVEDFASTVEQLSLDQQEATVAQVLTASAPAVQLSPARGAESARQTCGMPAGYAGARQPWYILRYSAARLDQIPQQLKSRLASGRYHEASVGACAAQKPTAFTAYTIAVLLYP